MIAALVTVPAVRRMPRETASSVESPRVVQLLDPAEDEHVVVHREPEEDDEEEHRQPRRDRVVGGEVEDALCPVVLEDQHEQAVRRADGEQVEARSP